MKQSILCLLCITTCNMGYGISTSTVVPSTIAVSSLIPTAPLKPTYISPSEIMRVYAYLTTEGWFVSARELWSPNVSTYTAWLIVAKTQQTLDIIMQTMSSLVVDVLHLTRASMAKQHQFAKLSNVLYYYLLGTLQEDTSIDPEDLTFYLILMHGDGTDITQDTLHKAYFFFSNRGIQGAMSYQPKSMHAAAGNKAHVTIADIYNKQGRGDEAAQAYWLETKNDIQPPLALMIIDPTKLKKVVASTK